MKKPALTARVKHRESILFRKTDEEAVLFDEDRGEAFLLNDTGYYLFEKIDGSKTVGDLVNEAVGYFDGERRQITDEVLDWIGEMHKLNILETIS
jgi:hypothetical protein